MSELFSQEGINKLEEMGQDKMADTVELGDRSTILNVLILKAEMGLIDISEEELAKLKNERATIRQKLNNGSKTHHENIKKATTDHRDKVNAAMKAHREKREAATRENVKQGLLYRK